MMCFGFDITKLIEISTSAFSTLIAAFLGAWAAFRFQSLQSAKERQSLEISAAHHAAFKLARQHHVLKVYREENLEPHRNSDGRLICVGAKKIITNPADLIDQGSLIFLVDRGYAQVLSSLIAVNENYMVIVENINRHSENYSNHLLPITSKVGEKVTLQQLEENIPAHHLRSMIADLDDNYIQVDKVCLELPKCLNDLHKAMKTMYPNGKFMAHVKGKPGEEIYTNQAQ